MIILNLFHGKKIKRRAIAQIVGTLMMVAVVASVGSVLLFQGMTGINNFNTYLTNTLQLGTNSAQESFVIEHVRFDPTASSKDIYIWIRNTGTVDLTIATIAVVRVDTQELVVYDTSVGQEVEMTDIHQLTETATFTGTDWGDIATTVDYRISVTTAEGNSKRTTTTIYNS